MFFLTYFLIYEYHNSWHFFKMMNLKLQLPFNVKVISVDQSVDTSTGNLTGEELTVTQIKDTIFLRANNISNGNDDAGFLHFKFNFNVISNVMPNVISNVFQIGFHFLFYSIGFNSSRTSPWYIDVKTSCQKGFSSWQVSSNRQFKIRCFPSYCDLNIEVKWFFNNTCKKPGF